MQTASHAPRPSTAELPSSGSSSPLAAGARTGPVFSTVGRPADHASDCTHAGLNPSACWDHQSRVANPWSSSVAPLPQLHVSTQPRSQCLDGRSWPILNVLTLLLHRTLSSTPSVLATGSRTWQVLDSKGKVSKEEEATAQAPLEVAAAVVQGEGEGAQAPIAVPTATAGLTTFISSPAHPP
jgi:hypothetical protein